MPATSWENNGEFFWEPDEDVSEDFGDRENTVASANNNYLGTGAR